MISIVLIKTGNAHEAFKFLEKPIPKPNENEILIKTQVSGLNFADVLARNGLYKDAPALPSVLGYEVVGFVESYGKLVTGFSKGDRVVAFTRFGGYAEYAVTDYKVAVVIPKEMDSGKAAALATQYCTAYYGAYELVNLFPGDRVLIHAAAGGVGTALVQLAKAKGCIVFGTAGSNEKMEYLKGLGVDYPINYNKEDFAEVIIKVLGAQRIDVVFDSVGGSVFSKSLKLLSHGGKIVCYGAAQRLGGVWGMLSTLKLIFDYGFILPIILLMTSKSVIGLNMLRIADCKPEIIQRCLANLLDLYKSKKINPQTATAFPCGEIAKAHDYLQSRRSTGKIIIEWNK
ncbi:MAG: zinc-binding dehydrogenase [Bacteroidetes bacterium]|nr:zinc-binding dehydrogenase [Bacteroidota bacterium]HET6244754.1 zinc-binding dehydrogenase [Bacteroidia bacterium]